MATMKEVGITSADLFARKSSGLVRNVSTLDITFYSLIQVVVPYVVFMVAFWVFYPGASMVWAAIFALLASICVGTTYALYSSVYPRSGGEYVFLSRTTHPLIGFVASFINIFWQLFYWGITGAWAASIGLAPFLTILGLQVKSGTLVSLGKFFGSSMGLFVWGAISVIVFSSILIRGMRTYFRIQRWITIAAILGWIVLIIVLVLGTVGVLNFKANFESYAGQGSISQIIAAAQAAGAELNPRVTVFGTANFIIWGMFSYLYAVLSVSFSGEIKNVKRGQLIGILGANIIGGFLIILTMIFAQGSMGSVFLRAAGYLSAVDPSKFPLPYSWLTLLASVLGNNVILTIIMGLSTVIFITLASATPAIYTTRGVLAWSIDGMAPSKLGEVSERYHSPTFAILVLAAITIILLALYSFTKIFMYWSGVSAMGMVFALVPLAGMIFPFTHRKIYESSPARIEIGKIPLMTITGFVGFVITAYVVYRGIVDDNYGANSPVAIGMIVGVIVIGVIWYFVARWYRRRQGVNMDARFKEIPIE